LVEQTRLYNPDMGRTPAAASEARQRILDTADRLFYAEGVRAVGIDRVIAEAGVAKATLYAHFPSKDDLIVATLRHREASVSEFFRTAMERHGRRTRDKLRAFFAALKDWFQSPGFRGCAFINAAVELADPGHPGSQYVRDYKERFRGMIDGLVEGAVGTAHAKLTPAVAILVEGAVVTAVIHQSADAADVARDAALALVAGAKGG
jgi:AcrR family transcriptional regulator